MQRREHLRAYVSRRKLCGEAHHPRPSVDGQRRQEHKRLPILHHHRLLPAFVLLLQKELVLLLLLMMLLLQVPCPWLDGKHTVFGKLISGAEVLKVLGQNVSDEDDDPAAACCCC